jgi:hypothetical protein
MMLLSRDYPGKNCNKDEACEGNATKAPQKKERERAKEGSVSRKEKCAKKKFRGKKNRRKSTKRAHCEILHKPI